MRVFLSSTFTDLKDHRAAVIAALERGDQEVGKMEVFSSQSRTSLAASIRELDRCEVFVGVYAHRYGTIPKGKRKSIVELELEYAEKRGLPVFAFLVDPEHPWPDNLRDAGMNAEKLRKLKKRIESRYVRTLFTTPDNLAAGVVAALLRHLNEKVEEEPLSSRSGSGSLLSRYDRDSELLLSTGESLAKELMELARMTKDEMRAHFSGYSDAEVYQYCVYWYTQGDLVLAERGYEIMLERSPEHVGALNDLGAVCSRLGNSDRALELLEKARRVDPESSTILSNLGIVYRDLGRIDDAERAYHDGMTKKPVYLGVFVNYSMLLRRQGRIDDALQISKKGVKAYPREFPALVELGRVYLEQGNIPDSMQWLKKAKDVIQHDVPAPEHSWVFENLALAYYRINDLSSAYKLLSRATKLDDANPESIHNLAVVASKLGHRAQMCGKTNEAKKYFRQAEDSYKVAIALAPEEYANHLHFAAMLLSAGRSDEALREAKTAYEMEPEGEQVRDAYAACLALALDLDNLLAIYDGRLPSSPLVLNAVVLGFLTRGELRSLRATGDKEKTAPLTEQEAKTLLPYVENLVELYPESDFHRSLLSRLKGIESGPTGSGSGGSI